MIRFLGEKILGKFLFGIALLIVLGPVLLLHSFVEAHPHIAWILPWIGFPLGFGGIVVAYCLSQSIAHYMCSENLMFLDAVKCALSDLKFNLSFLPIIGSLFTPDEDKTKPDLDD